MLMAWIPLLIGYLLGGIPFGLLIARVFGIEDIRSQGSGNIGATNVWRIAGWKAALWVFALDIGKGVLAVLFAKFWSLEIAVTPLNDEVWFALCGAASILGHVFPPMLGFKGGKGVNTALGVMIVLLPLESAMAASIFIVTLLISRFVSLASMVAAVAFAAITCYEKFLNEKEVSGFLVSLAILIAVLIIATHHKNISRLLSGSENKIRFGKSSDEKGNQVTTHV